LAAEPEREYVAILFALKAGMPVAWFLLQTVRIQRQLRTSRGLIGYSLRAQLAGKRFWTLSAWEDETTLQEFVHAPPHADIMTAIAPHMDATSFIGLEGKGFRHADRLG
jgi:hypothetical protein